MAITVGEVISGRYKVLRLIAEGGFGAVYLAQDNRLGNKEVALKEGFDRTPAAQEQFRLEAQLLANLQHVGLPRVTDYFIEPDGRQFLVMDYIAGQDLDQMVIDLGHPLPERQAAALLAQVSEAVAYLHTRRPQPIIHRDIKPANIKITPQGHAVLVDFGIAKLYHPMKGTAKVAKAVTKHYSPPEQHISKTDTRSDVYSLGATLYFATCLSLPPDAMDRLNQGAALTPPTRSNPSVSPVMESVILKCLELNPDDRFANANRVAAALRAFLSNQPVTLAPTGVPCPRCGFRNRPGAKFCVRDGANLTGAAVSLPSKGPKAPSAGSAVPVNPHVAKPVVQVPPELLFEQANVAASQGNLKQAIPRYEACLRQGFTNQAVYYNLATAYLSENRYGEAVRLLEDGTKRHSQDAELFALLADGYSRQKQTDRALAACEQASHLAPTDEAIMRQYGQLLVEVGLYLQAEQQLEKSLQKDPKSYTAHLMLGRAFGEQGELKKASSALHQAAKLKPDQAAPLIWVGIYFARSKKFREAAGALENALKIDPDAELAHAWLGETCLQQGQYAKAEVHLRRAAALNPNQAGYHARLGQCYALMKRRQEARVSLNKALQLDPGQQLARDWLKKI